MFGRNWSSTVPSTSVQVGRFRATSAYTRRGGPTFGRIWPAPIRIRPMLARFRPIRAWTRPTMCDFNRGITLMYVFGGEARGGDALFWQGHGKAEIRPAIRPGRAAGKQRVATASPFATEGHSPLDLHRCSERPNHEIMHLWLATPGRASRAADDLLEEGGLRSNLALPDARLCRLHLSRHTSWRGANCLHFVSMLRQRSKRRRNGWEADADGIVRCGAAVPPSRTPAARAEAPFFGARFRDLR